MLNTHAKAWIEALRSGNYKQGRLRLHTVVRDNESRFCCLGVACDLYRNEGGGEWVTSRCDPSVYSFNRCDFSSTHVLPGEVAAWLGLISTDGVFKSPSKYELDTSLMILNDFDKLNFSEIANVIESQPEGLFNAE